MAQERAEISGSVRDLTDLPLPGVALELKGPRRVSTQSDHQGSFEVPDLPNGEYELTAALVGFATIERKIHLRPGERTVVALTMSVQIFEQTVVTASKTGEADIQATPMAISSLSGATLESLQAHTIADIAGLAPAVTFSQNSDFAQLSIRGIGTNVVFAGSDPSSAVYADGVYLARPVMILNQFLDLERVEVLRGPQGTLYGRNAVGGAINLISKPPTNDLDASARLVVGNYDTLRAEARVSGPLAAGKISGSAAFVRGVQSGYVQDLDHPDHPLGGEDITAGRAQMRIAFSPRADLLVAADAALQQPTPLSYAKVLEVKPGFQVDNPNGLRNVRASTQANSRNQQYGTLARFGFDLTPAIRLTSLSAFRSLDYKLLVDADITELSLTSSQPHETQHQLSEELTVAGRSSRLNWIGGLFFFSEHDEQPTRVGLLMAKTETLLDPRVDADTGALFGQATYAAGPRLSVTAGLRYSDERKAIDNSGRGYPVASPAETLPGSAYAYTDSISNTAWTPKVGVETRTSDHSLLYASATRGFKSGGFNLTSRQVGRGYGPESAWSYEGGYKSTLAGGRSRLTFAAFYTDYRDLQVQTAIIPGVIDISNAAAATIRGVEVETVNRLTASLQAGGHAAWLDARYDQYIAVGVGGVTGDVAGRRLTNAPEWSGRAWIDWSPRLVAYSLSLRADSIFQSTIFFTPFNDTIQRQSAYGLVNASAELGPAHRRWAVSLFVRNLIDTDYITGSFSSPPPAIGGRPGEPRQVGFQLVVRR